MKQLCVIILFFCSLMGHGQSADSLRAALVPVDVDSSAIGKPAGEAIIKTIGPEGGTISSADGLMELRIPPGALAIPTPIGIQPIESTSVMNIGKTYACTPDGLHFQKPVSLVLHFADSLTKEVIASIPAIRWQDNSGRWSSLEKIHLDSAAHTLSGGIEHFSNYSASLSLRLSPRSKKIRVNGKYDIELLISVPNPRKKGGSSYLVTDSNYWKVHSVEWSVNGVVGGNDDFGWIGPYSRDEQNIATYIAPSRIPASPPMIRAKYTGLVDLGADTYTDNAMTLAMADVYDEFHYLFSGKDQVGHLEMIDASSCDIRAYSSGTVELSNIKNTPPWSDWPAKIGTCNYTYPDKTGWKGLVQIEGMASGTFERPYVPAGGAPANPRIHIQLTVAEGSSPRYTVRCKGGGTKTVNSATVTAMPRTIDLELVENDAVLIHFGPETSMNILEVNRGGQGFKIMAARNP